MNQLQLNLNNISNSLINIHCNMKNIIKLLRPQQWLKNLFVFLPLFFSRHLLDLDYIIPTTIAFIAYNFAASSIYCFNDINDVESDKKHPTKKDRPIASGQISKKQAYILMTFMLMASVVIILFYLSKNNYDVLILILSYYVLNILYTKILKNIPIIDVFIVAFGFVLRLFVGGACTNIWISHWIVLMTFLLTLFLSFAKRRDDMVIYNSTGVATGHNINSYSFEFVNETISILASITMVCYIMYTVSEDVIARMNSSYLYVTSIFVLAGIVRYLQITIVDMKSGNPTKVLIKDRFLHVCIVGWIITFFIIIYT